MKMLRHSALVFQIPNSAPGTPLLHCASRIVHCALILAALVVPAFSLQASSLSPGAGCYQYKDAETGKTLNVWYYKPAGFTPQTPVLIMMHGMSRKAESYRNSWVDYARDGNFMMLTPEFSNEDFPGDKAYNFGNVVLPGDKINAREKWTFMIVERIFDDFLKSREQTGARQYYLYGHSAGAQFAHRFLLFVPEARVKLAVCANAGSYTLPNPNDNWPWGLKGSGLTENSVRRYLSVPMVILLGENDIDPKDRMLSRGKNVDRQGVTRVARGVHFFNYGQAAAEKLNTPFGWKIRFIPGAPHGGPLIHAAAAKIFAADINANPSQ